jgi:hypothetical protein
MPKLSKPAVKRIENRSERYRHHRCSIPMPPALFAALVELARSEKTPLPTLHALLLLSGLSERQARTTPEGRS